MNSILKSIKPFDVVIILYSVLTGFFMLLGLEQLGNLSLHILIRVLILFLVSIFIAYDKIDNKTFQFIRNFYPLLLLGFFYSETAYYNNFIFTNFDPLLVKLEQIVFGAQLSLEFSDRITYTWFSELMHFGYFSYYLLILGIPLILYVKAREFFDKNMFVLVFSFCLYYLFFVLFPSVGPQFYFPVAQQQVPNGFIFEKIMGFILKYGETETGAFPSSHVGISIVLLIICFKHFKYLLIGTIPIVLLLIFSTVYIKAHYAIDIIAGVLTGLFLYYISIVSYKIYCTKTHQKIINDRSV